jgi:hypothetical protein
VNAQGSGILGAISGISGSSKSAMGGNIMNIFNNINKTTILNGDKHHDKDKDNVYKVIGGHGGGTTAETKTVTGTSADKGSSKGSSQVDQSSDRYMLEDIDNIVAIVWIKIIFY